MDLNNVSLEMITGKPDEQEKKLVQQVGALHDCEVGKIIRYARKKNNISSEELAEKLQISVEEMEEIENGVIIPDKEILKKMSSIIKVNYANLLLSAGYAYITSSGYYNLKGESVEVDEDVIEKILNNPEQFQHFSEIISEI